LTMDSLTKQPNWQLRACCKDCHANLHEAAL
jgi:hypothetical protein